MPLRSYQTRADFARDYSSPYLPTDDNPVEGHADDSWIVGGERPVLEYGHRWLGLRYGASYADALTAALNLQPTQVILIVGAGFCWTAEVLESRGFTRVLGIDTSAYIQAAKSTDDESDLDAAIANLPLNHRNQVKAHAHSPGPRVRASRGVLNESGSNAGSRNAIRSAAGLSGSQRFDVGISEFIIEGLTDSECGSASSMMRAICTRVVHFTTAVEALQANVANGDTAWNVKTLAAWKLLLASGDEFLDTARRLV